MPNSYLEEAEPEVVEEQGVESGNNIDTSRLLDECENVKVYWENDFIDVDGTELPGRIITASVAGIIKSTHGLCWRDGKEEYDKNWSQEKGVRIKMG